MFLEMSHLSQPKVQSILLASMFLLYRILYFAMFTSCLMVNFPCIKYTPIPQFIVLTPPKNKISRSTCRRIVRSECIWFEGHRKVYIAARVSVKVYVFILHLFVCLCVDTCVPGYARGSQRTACES